MRPRYLLAVGTSEPVPAELMARLEGNTSLRVAFSQPRLAAFVNQHCRCLPVGESGCVIGALFHRHGRAAPIDTLDTDEEAQILGSNGDRLTGRFWGGYVAAVDGGPSVRVMRDPSAALSCYFALGPGYALFASDAELLVEDGCVAVDLDWRALALHFFSAGVPTATTSLRGIWELLPGFSLRFPNELECQVPFWSPWDHVHEQADGSALAAERLARTVKHCVGAWAAAHGRLLVSVSGGVDSSIVAAGLAAAGAEAACLTMYTDDPAGDERVYARALCEHLGIPLLEQAYRLEDIDIAEPLGAHLPRTKDRTQALAYEHAHLKAAQDMNASAFMTGNGGDSVFAYSQSAAAVSDRYLSHGLGFDVLRTLRDVCVQTGCGVFEAAASSLRIARGPRAYRCRPDPLFLHADVLSELEGTKLHHPWLEAPPGALPGKAAHIASILRVQQCLEADRGRYLPVLNPLMSQPIIETCLSIPSWEWRSGGTDRSLARRAFADDLPPVILRRRVKGGPDGFAARIVDCFRAPIRERLLEGHLCRERIIDSDTLVEALDERQPMTGEERVRILEFLAAEAWLDSWTSRAATGQKLLAV